VGSLSQFEEYANPLLRAHLSAGNGVGGIGFLKAVEDADYFLHNVILLWLLVASRGSVPASEGARMEATGGGAPGLADLA
jgi:hypothetical protein